MKVDLKQRLRLWLKANGLMALVALVLAVIVYMTILELVSNATTRTIPIEIEREPGLALMAVRPATAEVTFRGALTEFQQLDRSDLRFAVRVPRGMSEAGVARLSLRPRNLKGVAGLRVMNIQPSEVEITFDHQGEREFPIAPPILDGKPFRGRAEAEYTPRTAVVRGARLQLDRLHNAGVTLQMVPVNVDGRVQGFSRQAPILPPEEAWSPEISPATVQVKVTIVPDNIQREFGDIPVRLTHLADQTNAVGWRVEPASVKVRLTGWVEALGSISSHVIRVYADFPGAAASSAGATNMLPLRVLLPQGATVEEVVAEPAEVRLAFDAQNE